MNKKLSRYKTILNKRDLNFIWFTNIMPLRLLKAGAVDYLLKPEDIEEFQESIEKIKKHLNKKPSYKIPQSGKTINNTLTFNVKEGILIINEPDILKVEADGSYVTVYLQNGIKHTISKNLKEFSEQITTSSLIRGHASYIINLKCIQKIIKQDGLFVELSDKTKVPVPRKHKDQLLEIFKE